MADNLKIRIINELPATIFIYIFLGDVTLSSKSFKVEPWQKQYIAPGAKFYDILPLQLQAEGEYRYGTAVYRSKTIDIDYFKSYELYTNNGALDISPSQQSAPINNTINIFNKCDYPKDAVILKGDKPIFKANVRPSNNLNFDVKSSIFLYINTKEIPDDNPSTIASSPNLKLDYTDASYLTITLKLDTSTNRCEFEYNFNYFDYP